MINQFSKPFVRTMEDPTWWRQSGDADKVLIFTFEQGINKNYYK